MPVPDPFTEMPVADTSVPLAPYRFVVMEVETYEASTFGPYKPLWPNMLWAWPGSLMECEWPGSATAWLWPGSLTVWVWDGSWAWDRVLVALPPVAPTA